MLNCANRKSGGAEKEEFMRIQQMYAPIALDYTEKIKSDNSVSFNAGLLNEYRDALKKIAKTSNYTEGQKISEKDLAVITKSMGKLFDSAVMGFSMQDNNFKREFDGKDYVFAAYDYLFALAMNELNCPDIPKEPLENMLCDFSVKLSREIPMIAPSINEQFNKQRYQDAAYLENIGIRHLLYPDENRKYPPRQVAALYAEYRALQERQKNHGAIWRAFHSKENKARNDLLKRMEDIITKTIPEDVFKNLKEPADILKYHEGNRIVTYVKNFMHRRDYMPHLDYGYKEYLNTPSLYDEYMKKRENAKNVEQKSETEIFTERLKKDTSETTANKSERRTKQTSTPTLKITQ